MADLEFKSPKDGSVLAFDLMQRRSTEVEFKVTVTMPLFKGIAEATTYVSGSPSTMFRDMANQWKGWKETKAWEDIEGRVAFSAMADSTGHVNLSVELTGADYTSHLCAVLQYEAGQLEDMANQITRLLG